MRNAVRIVALVIVLGACGCASTGAIQGILAPPRLTTQVGRARVAGGAARADSTLFQDAVAFVMDDLESRPRNRAKTKPERVRQTRAGFEPRVLVVPAGTTVAFENCDRIYHSVFSVTKAKRFDTGLFAPGQERPVLFDRPGIVNLYCSLHPRTAGFLVVLANCHYARPDARGEFRLPALREGIYTVKAWHPLYGETSSRVRVTKNGSATVRLAF